LYCAPTGIRTFMKWGTQFPEAHDLSSLRVLGTVGEPINPEAWVWYWQHIGGGRCPVVESALVDHRSVAEAACVGAKDETTGQAIIAFVTLRTGNEPSQAHGEELREHVAKKIGRFGRPKTVIFTDDLPKTRSGKIMRRLLKDVAEGRDLGDTTTLADATVVDEIRRRAAVSTED